MTREEAKLILAAYPRVEMDPEVKAALKLIQEDSGLRQWFENQQKFNATATSSLNSIQPPRDLKARIIAQKPIVPSTTFWKRPSLIAAAATILLLASLSILINPQPKEDRFETYRSRMVRTVLREYRMDIATNNIAAVNDYLAKMGAPADFRIPDALSQMKLTGAGILRWQNQPVAMVCFDRGDEQMVFLFVSKSSTMNPPPPVAPLKSQVSHLLTASWTDGEKTYILAGPPGTPILEKM